MSTQLSSVLAGSDPIAFGIVCDVYDFAPPPHLQAASFQARSGDILDRDTLDVVIAYKMAGLDVALQIPAEVAVDPVATLALASSVDVGICLLPPVSGVTASWLDLVGRFTAAYCAAPNFGRGLYPVTDVLALEMTRILGAGSGNVATGLDVWGRHVAGMLGRDADAVRQRVVAGFEDHHGGRGGFIEFCHEQFAVIYAASRQIIEDRVEAYMREPGAEA